MNIYSTFLKFRKKDQTTLLTSVGDIMDSGFPIDEDDGDELELVDNLTYRSNGTVIE